MLSTLYGRLALALLVLLTILAAAWIVIAVRAAELYSQEVRQTLHRELADHLIHDGVLLRDGEVDPEGLEHVIHMLMVVNPAIEVYVVDPSGEILAFSAPPGAVRRQRISLEPVRAFLSGSRKLPLHGDDPRDPDGVKVFSAAAIGDAVDPEGFVYVVLGGSRHDSIAARLRGSFVLRQAGLAAAAALAAALIAGLVLFRILTRRLRRLMGRVESLSSSEMHDAGPWEREAAPPAGDEIDQLESSFDRMAERIGQQMEELARVDEVRRELIANVSHDLRTPLASLQGYLETLELKRDELSEDEQRRYLEIASRHAAQLRRRIGDLFELARLDAHAVAPTWEEFSLPELAHDVVQEFRIAAERKRIELRVVGRRDLPFVRADIGLVERALENLVGNAIRHTPGGGEVCVSVEGRGPHALVEVRDTGSGIAEDQRASIFDRYYRSRDQEGETSGAGLGLAIAKRIVELHGGTIEVARETRQGAAFRITLPMGPAGTAPEPAAGR